MSKTLTVGQVIKILESAVFDELIGAIEDECLECKGAPYVLKEEYQRRELAKDVAALANAEGGIILLGVNTERNPIHLGDEIKKIREFPENLIGRSQYDDVLGSWIYPTLQGVNVEWFAGSKDAKKGRCYPSSKPTTNKKTFSSHADA
jgi:Putative DNA-binding domain